MPRRQYGSGSVSQRKDGMWIGRLEAGTGKDGRRRRVVVSAVTEARCKERLEEAKRDVARSGVPEKTSARRMTVALWAEEWLELTVTELRPKSYNSDASAVKVWIVPTIGRKRLDTLTPADIRSVFDAQRKAGKKEGTRIRTHSTLMSMLKAAMLEGYDIPPRILLVKKPKPGENDREDIDIDDVLAILKIAETHPDFAMWAGILLQGLRKAERLGLTWDCVDFNNGTIDISWQLQALPYIDVRNKSIGFRVPDGYTTRHLTRALHLVRPKTAKGRRVVPMTTWMEGALRKWRDVAPSSPHGLVWPDADGQPRDVKDDLEEWKQLQELADVHHPSRTKNVDGEQVPDNYVLHEARHTTATLLLDLGVDKDTVAAILGQSKFIETYDHSDRTARSRAALERVAERLALR